MDELGKAAPTHCINDYDVLEWTDGCASNIGSDWVMLFRSTSVSGCGWLRKLVRSFVLILNEE